MSNFQETVRQTNNNACEIGSKDASSSFQSVDLRDVVDTPQSEAYQSQPEPSLEAAFSAYCTENPEAGECRIYED